MRFDSLYVALSLAGYVYAQAGPHCDKDLVARQNNNQRFNQGQNGGQQGGNGGQQNNNQGNGGQSQAGQGNQVGQAQQGNQGQNQGNQAQGGDANLQLDPSLVQDAAFNNGLIATSNAATVGSLTSNNNFLDFCKGKTITNGQQNTAGSCNPSPMGSILALDKFPSHKFQNPKNGDTIPANQDFNIVLKVANLQLGTFTEPTTTYYLAPAQVNGAGTLIGHTHVTIQPISSLDSTDIRDATQFVFFKGVNDAGDGQGTVTVPVPGGLPAGTYTLGSLGSAANHQPPLPSKAQRGMGDDIVYFTVSDNAGAGAGAGPGQGGNAGAGAGQGGQNAGGQGQNAGGQGQNAGGQGNQGNQGNQGGQVGQGNQGGQAGQGGQGQNGGGQSAQLPASTQPAGQGAQPGRGAQAGQGGRRFQQGGRRFGGQRNRGNRRQRSGRHYGDYYGRYQ